jgi:hypothetical protein
VHASTIASASASGPPNGLSTWTALMPGDLDAVTTAAFMYLAGVTTDTMSGSSAAHMLSTVAYQLEPGCSSHTALVRSCAAACAVAGVSEGCEKAPGGWLSQGYRSQCATDLVRIDERHHFRLREGAVGLGVDLTHAAGADNRDAVDHGEC